MATERKPKDKEIKADATLEHVAHAKGGFSGNDRMGDNHTSGEEYTHDEAQLKTEGGEGAESPEVEQETGISDEAYNLVSICYHALHGAEQAAIYCEDAEDAGDKELVRFFEQVRDEDRKRAHDAMRLLDKHLRGDHLAGIAPRPPSQRPHAH